MTEVTQRRPRKPLVKLENGWWTVWFGSIRIRRFHQRDEAIRFANILSTNRNTQQRRRTA